MITIHKGISSVDLRKVTECSNSKDSIHRINKAFNLKDLIYKHHFHIINFVPIKFKSFQWLYLTTEVFGSNITTFLASLDHFVAESDKSACANFAGM